MKNNINESVKRVADIIQENILGRILTLWAMDSKVLGFIQVNGLAVQGNSFFDDSRKDTIANGNYLYEAYTGDDDLNNGKYHGIEVKFDFVDMNEAKKLNDMEWEDIADIKLRIKEVEARLLTDEEIKESLLKD